MFLREGDRQSSGSEKIIRRAQHKKEIRTKSEEEERKQCAMKIPQFGYVWRVSTVSSVRRRGTRVILQREVASSRAGVAGVVEREALLELLSLGLADTLPLPLPAPPAILLWPTRDRGPGGVLSEWVGGAPDAEEEVEEEGVPIGTLLPPGSPCRP